MCDNVDHVSHTVAWVVHVHGLGLVLPIHLS